MRIIILPLLLFFVYSACSTGISSTDGTTHTPDKQVLLEAWRQSENSLIIYPAEDTLLRDFFADYLQRFKQGGLQSYSLRSDLEIETAELASKTLFIVGVFSDNSPVQQIISGLPVQLKNNHFIFNKITYDQPNDILRISLYPNPLTTEFPVAFITGNTATGILSYLSNKASGGSPYLMWESWGYQVIRHNRRLALGNYNNDFTLDTIRQWAFDYTGKKVGGNEHFTFIDHSSGLQPAQFDSIELYTHRNISHFESVFGVEAGGTFPYHIFKSTEIKGLMYNNTDQCHVDLEMEEVYSVYENEFGEHYSGNEMELIIRKTLGTSPVQALEKGLSAYFNPKWEEKGSYYWACLLYQANAAPSLTEMLDNDAFESGSPLITQACAGLFAAFLLEKIGPAEILTHYQTWTATDLIKWKKVYADWVQNQLADFMPEKRIRRDLPSFLKGFNFAHEGYQVYNGYIGSEAAASLRSMRDIGCNTTAIIPYTFAREINAPVKYPFAKGAGMENDASVIRSSFVARQNEMYVMLKPQVWCRYGWPGDIEMQNEADWDAFFKNYETWILHYALLAEMYGLDILSVGVEFQKATLAHPEKWEAIFKKVRQVYQGYMTYSANWGSEFEKADFWDELDFISVNCYYPLSKKSNPSDAELLAGFEEILDKLEKVDQKYDKPLLITEIGFKSIAQPWLNPHLDDDDQDISQESQVRCYQVMFEALQDEDWIKGIYLWQWPTYMNYIESNPKGFTPAGKDAEKVVEYYFQQWD